MAKAITVAIIIIMGERIRVRKTWSMVMRMVLTSVVALVIRLGVEKRSVFAKEKLWIFSKSPVRRFFAKPWLATAEKRAAKRPQAIESIATITIIPPTVRTNLLRSSISAWGKNSFSIKFSSR